MNYAGLRRITRDGRWIPEIDGLRFLAITSVVLFHLLGELLERSGHHLPIEPRYAWLFGMIRNGDRGVQLFFVISGVILAMPFARQYLVDAKEVSLKKYYLRRVTRLEPPYIVSVLLFTMMIALYSRGQLMEGYGWHALASLFYLHNLTYGGPSPVNPVTWSLEVEIQFYLLAPVVMQVFRLPGKMRRRVVMATGILGLGLAQLPFWGNQRFELSILYYLQYFLAGLLLADVFVLDLPEVRSSWIWDAAGIVGLAFMFEMPHELPASHVLMPFALALICMAVMRSFALRRVAANSWVAVTGGMCYSIYLIHFALMAALFKISQHLIVGRLDFLGNYLLQLVVVGGLILLASVQFYIWVERPCMDPDWPSKFWQRLTGRRGDEVELLDTAGIGEERN
jgi:peptidoglycan/LPS O-acetylase OafA/YrhL